MNNIELDKDKKHVIIKGSGMYNEDELSTFINEYKSKMASIDTSQYSLILDTKSLKTSHQDKLPMMKKIMKMYFETPFLKRYYIKPDSRIASNQMKRITEDELCQSLQFIASYDAL
ncbi:hypothetical protein EZV73_08165 [Acidaminobacter sp. JC074]|uniref:hypothetical protein n=1 Tax=Acidaminobacter sp. JC074 TaxID=2530199 RepID=UPI001F0D7FF2|nr:hypothetical protein [Acidaminobacter sp. JC074]MCH4887543.1 hypothetical protein [Acidaminobacter sp. JC074]